MEESTIELLELGTEMEIQAPFCTGRKHKLYWFVSFLDAEAYKNNTEIKANISKINWDGIF